MREKESILHRDDPDAEPLVGNIKVTRQDWLNVAMDVLVSHGVEQVKVLGLADRLGVSRSSFYWYFKSRQDLLDALLKLWEDTNTAALVSLAEAPADTITGAVCNVFRCVVDPNLFNTALDFAVREWARRSGKVRRVLDQSDQRRLGALTAMFERYGFGSTEAMTRARILYYMQNGYNAADLNESLEDRMALVPYYLLGFTGQQPRPQDVETLRAHASRAQSQTSGQQ